MKMIKVRVSDQNQINRRKIFDLHTGLAQSLQNKQPSGEVWIHNDVLPAHLNKKGRMANERQPEFAVGHEARLVSLAGTGSNDGVLHQPPESRSTLAQRGGIETRLGLCV